MALETPWRHFTTGESGSQWGFLAALDLLLGGGLVSCGKTVAPGIATEARSGTGGYRWSAQWYLLVVTGGAMVKRWMECRVECRVEGRVERRVERLVERRVER